MSWIPIYADNNDFELIFERLDSDSNIALILSQGKHKWIAKNQIGHLSDGRYLLWHIPAGPLPLVSRNTKENEIIADPFAGWTEYFAGGDPTIPYFRDTPAIISLSVHIQGVDSPNSIGISAFGWIGNHYRPIGISAKKETFSWWRGLRNWVAKVAIAKVSPFGPINGPNQNIWAFPSAYDRIARGEHRDLNPV